MLARFPVVQSLTLKIVTAVFLLLGVVGCVKKGGEATVREKNYLPAQIAQEGEDKGKELLPERWQLKVVMEADGRRVDVLVDRPEWEKLQPGDRVKVEYSQGKYTGTIWNSELK